jgi:hypothetical protein
MGFYRDGDICPAQYMDEVNAVRRREPSLGAVIYLASEHDGHVLFRVNDDDTLTRRGEAA